MVVSNSSDYDLLQNSSLMRASIIQLPALVTICRRRHLTLSTDIILFIEIIGNPDKSKNRLNVSYCGETTTS